jgi:tetratricopeptide (TPR) repeat protein
VKLTAGGVMLEEVCLAQAGETLPPKAPDAPPIHYAPCGTIARRAADIVQRYSALVGPFPGKTLTIVPELSSLHGPTANSTPGSLVISNDVALFEDVIEYKPGLLPLAIARQWFPAAASGASHGDRWLAESLADYLAWRYLLKADPEAARVRVAEAMSDLTEEWRMLGRRGMLVLRTLETVIDRERVDRVLAEYYRRYGGHSASPADFEKVCEEVSGRNLAWFFHYFVEGTEIPEIELRRLPSESPGIVAGEIVVKNFPPEGTVRVEMGIRTAQGNIEHSVATRGGTTPFTVNVPSPALSISVDPDLRILRWTEAARRWRAQELLLSRLPEALIVKGIPAALALLRQALAADEDDAALRAQYLHEFIGRLEFERGAREAAMREFDAAVEGHSLDPSETYLLRGTSYVYRASIRLQQGHLEEARENVRLGLALPPAILVQMVESAPPDRSGHAQLGQLLVRLDNTILSPRKTSP